MVFFIMRMNGPSFRSFLSLSFGFLVGSLLSLIIFPQFQKQLGPNECIIDQNADEHKVDADPKPLEMMEETAEHWQIHINPPSSIQSANELKIQSARIKRPRFYATELGVRDKLFVGVITSSSRLSTVVVAVNLTVCHHVSRLQFFVDEDDPNDSPPLFVQNLTGLNLLPFRSRSQPSYVQILNAIASQPFHSNYDWFFFAPDSVYIKAFKLYEFVSHLSIGQSVVIGRKKDDGLCDFNAGLLLSHLAMEQILKSRTECLKITGETPTIAFELCIHSMTNLTCMEELDGKPFRNWELDANSQPLDGETLKRADQFNGALTVFPLKLETDYFSLHRHLVLAEIDQMRQAAVGIESDLYNLSIDTPDGPQWPAGLPALSSPKTRYEVPKWELFTASHIFANEPGLNVEPLVGLNLKDVQQVIEFGRQHVEQSASDSELTFSHLMNGYRLFDPIRGMNYILDLMYSSASNPSPVHRRVHLVRPLTRTELIHQVPFVKEDVGLTLILPVHNPLETRRFFARFTRHCLLTVEEKRFTRLVVVVLKMDKQLTRDLAEMRNRCASTNVYFETLMVQVHTNESLVPIAVGMTISRYGPEMMYLVLTTHTDMQSDFLDKARINTIRGFQVFFPIPFVEYHPKVVTTSANFDQQSTKNTSHNDNSVKNPSISELVSRQSLKVHKDVGHFDADDWTIACFYGVDFLRHRTNLDHQKPGKIVDVSRVFLNSADLHLMRTTEPGLHIRHHVRECPRDLLPEDYDRCMMSRRHGLASKAQMANLLFMRDSASSTKLSSLL